MKKLLIAAAAVLFVAPVFAQDDANLNQFVQLLKMDLRHQAKDVIRQKMVTFTDQEASKFWPVYDAYMTELGNFLDARVALISSYADNYDKMTDAEAQRLMDRRFDQLKQRAKLDEKYRALFAPTLSPRRLVRFWQIQHELEILIELKAVSQVPLMKWWQE